MQLPSEGVILLTLKSNREISFLDK